jgi:hypothetical protein
MIRIVGLSATLPNYEDVATFLNVNLQTGVFCTTVYCIEIFHVLAVPCGFEEQAREGKVHPHCHHRDYFPDYSQVQLDSTWKAYPA